MKTKRTRSVWDFFLYNLRDFPSAHPSLPPIFHLIPDMTRGDYYVIVRPSTVDKHPVHFGSSVRREYLNQGQARPALVE